MKKEVIKDIFKTISPLLINPTKTSITLSLSRRFFLFQILQKLAKEIEEEPYLNFLTVLKNYKLVGRVLHGTIKEMYKDRNKFYFKNFFLDRDLYELVKKDIEELYPKYKEINVILSKHGTIIYDNYKKNSFNVLLLTIHAGQWVPKEIENKMCLPKIFRKKEEDKDSDKLYSLVVLEKGGIWVSTKLSRFVCDLNRPQNRCIYFKDKEKWLHRKVWKDDLKENDIKKICSWHLEFYATLEKLLESYSFNIIFDGHTMKDKPDRPRVSIGTKYISSFYMPIVRSMRNKLSNLGYKPVLFNKPYGGGFILKWLKAKFPDRFIFSMEFNKKLYMKPNRRVTLKRKLNKIKKDMPKVFELELE